MSASMRFATIYLSGILMLSVRWDRYDNAHFHNCSGYCDFGHGWYVPGSDIVIHFNDTTETDFEIGEIGDLLSLLGLDQEGVE